ncbi:formylglycine-generating enzyme family protein [bacterium]|nr:formylglycine-generating enzyme family protein [bacterium]
MRAAFLCCGIMLHLILFTTLHAEPAIVLQTDRGVYSASDTIELSLGGENPDSGMQVAIYLGLLSPDGSIHAWSDMGWGESIVPWLADVFITGGFVMQPAPFCWMGLPCTMPPVSEAGEYHFILVLTDAETSEWVHVGSTAWTYSNGQPASITMVPIPEGLFMMGSPENEADRRESEGPQRMVSVSAFLMSKTEVTQRQWEDVMGWNDSMHGTTDDFPVEQVTWLDCVDFCNKLSRAHGLLECYTITGIGYDEDDMHITAADVSCNFEANGYRLPTEAEWEYACRAGTSIIFYAGELEVDFTHIAWYLGNSGGGPHPAGQKMPNVFGLHDMHGNAWEWCWDWYDPDYYGTRPNPDSDPKGADVPPAMGAYRTYKGGGFYSPPDVSRVALRGCCSSPGTMCTDLGFRIARRDLGVVPTTSGIQTDR